MSNTTYAPATWVKTKETTFGPILKLSVKTVEFTEFLKQNTNERGYVNLDIVQRREVGQNGETHSVKLDDWKPSGQAAQGAPQAPARKAPAPRRAPVTPRDPDLDVPPDDIPF